MQTQLNASTGSRCRFKFGLLLLVFSVSGCAHVVSSSISEMAPGSGRRIYARDTSHGVLMLTLPPLDAAARLRGQCAGTITGVQTTTIVRNYWLIQHYEQRAEGWCLDAVR